MSDSESGDEMEKLQSILNEHPTKPNPLSKEKAVKNETIIDNPTEWIRSEEEIRLDKLIFGDKEGLLENLKKSSSKATEESQTKKRKPAWHDEDDYTNIDNNDKRSKRIGQPLNEHLKSEFERVVNTPKWADLDQKTDIDSDEEILQTVGFLSNSKTAALPSHDISTTKLKNLNNNAEGCITSIQFHPTSTVAMVSGTDCIATLYSIDGETNDSLHSIFFKKFPILCAKILNCGTKAMFSSDKYHYFTYDLMRAAATRHSLPRDLLKLKLKNFEVSPDGKYFVANGRCGELHLFDLKCKELIHTFKQGEPCEAIKFSLDSSKIIASSTGCSINIFDIRQQRVMHTFIDDGCIKGQSMALSPDGRMLATGSAEGAVNIYEYQKVLASKSPQPEKTILNLTTAISGLNFNHTSEILGMCSKEVYSAVKLVHFPTGTVFANFPNYLTTKLRSVREIEFSPSSGYMALGNVEKQVHLYRLEHFGNY